MIVINGKGNLIVRYVIFVLLVIYEKLYNSLNLCLQLKIKMKTQS